MGRKSHVLTEDDTFDFSSHRVQHLLPAFIPRSDFLDKKPATDHILPYKFVQTICLWPRSMVDILCIRLWLKWLPEMRHVVVDMAEVVPAMAYEDKGSN